MTFSGKQVWLIGASEGIGEALAKQLARAGAVLTLSARNSDRLATLQRELGAQHRLAVMDVTDPETIARAWAVAASPLPDLVIYNAGTYEPMDATQFDLAKAERMVEVNFTGALRVLSHILKPMIAANAGHIALVASVAGYRGLPAAIGYGASKAALLHLAENLKADLAHTQLKVQVINPGFVKTRLTDKNDFAMPAIISPERAADYIVQGLSGSAFEIHFPKRFSRIMKLLAALPAPLYFFLLKRMKF